MDWKSVMKMKNNDWIIKLIIAFGLLIANIVVWFISPVLAVIVFLLVITPVMEWIND